MDGYSPPRRPHLVVTGVLHDLRAQVAALDGPQVLLVALLVAGVLVEHVRGPRLRLGLDDGVPHLLGLDHALGLACLLVPGGTQGGVGRAVRLAVSAAKQEDTFGGFSPDAFGCEMGLTWCRASQTPPPSIRPALGSHWGTSETIPVGWNVPQ